MKISALATAALLIAGSSLSLLNCKGQESDDSGSQDSAQVSSLTDQKRQEALGLIENETLRNRLEETVFINTPDHTWTKEEAVQTLIEDMEAEIDLMDEVLENEGLSLFKAELGDSTGAAARIDSFKAIKENDVQLSKDLKVSKFEANRDIKKTNKQAEDGNLQRGDNIGVVETKLREDIVATSTLKARVQKQAKLAENLLKQGERGTMPADRIVFLKGQIEKWKKAETNLDKQATALKSALGEATSKSKESPRSFLDVVKIGSGTTSKGSTRRIRSAGSRR